MKRIIIVLLALVNVAYGQQWQYKALGEAAKRIAVDDSTSLGKDSSNLVSSRAVYSDLQNVYNTRARFLNVWKKLLSGTTISGSATTRGKVRLRVAGFGDSVGGYVFTPFTNLLIQMFGFGGGIYGSVATTGGGSIHSNNDETTYWFNGNWYEINGSGSLTFTYAGGRMSSTLLKVYYIKEPGAGTFQVQVDAGAGYVNEGSVVDADDALAGGVISIPKSQGSYSIRINQVSGNVKIIMCVGINEPADYDGVTVLQMNVGGLDWEEANATDKAITNPVFSDLGIDLATVMFKEGSNIYSLFKDWSTAFQTASPTTDWVLIGSQPQQTNDDINKGVNRDLSRIALENNWYYLDGYSPFINYDTLVAKGWNGDGLHPAAAVGYYMAAQLCRIIGVDNGILLGRNSGTDPTGDQIFQMGKGTKYVSTSNNNAYNGRIAASTTSTDLDMNLQRNLNFKTGAGTQLGNINASVSFMVDGTNPGTINQRGYTFAVTNSPGLYMPNDSTISLWRNRGAGTRMHFWANNGDFLGSMKVGSLPSYSSGGFTPIGRNSTTNQLEAITFSPPTTTTANSTLSLAVSSTGESIYIHNGTGATWTLPAVPANGSQLKLINGTTNNVTVNSNAGGNDIISYGTAVSSITIGAGTTRTLTSNGTSWYLSYNQYVFSSGLINTLGNVTADTAVIATKAYRQKGIDSLGLLNSFGEYTPTIVNNPPDFFSNVTSSTGYLTSWKREGNWVTLDGTLDVDYTSSSTITAIAIPLPSGLESDFSSFEQVTGIASVRGLTSGIGFPVYCAVHADTTNDRINIAFQTMSGSAETYRISFHIKYKLL